MLGLTERVLATLNLSIRVYRQRILTFLQSQSLPFKIGLGKTTPESEMHHVAPSGEDALAQQDQTSSGQFSYENLDQAVRETLDAAGLLKVLTEHVTNERNLTPSESFEDQSKKALHDLRTPLNAVMGYGGLLAQKDLDNATRERCLKAFHDAGDALLEIMNHGFQVSSYQEADDTHQCDVLAAGRECFELIALEAKEREIILFDRLTTTSQDITIDAAAFKRVLLNLLSNALRYTDSGGAIEITNHSDAKNIYISVTDTGCGMSEATLMRAMAHGTRGLEAKLKAPEGQGIGLANAQELLKLAGGSIELSSKINGGTKATVSLPLNGANDADISTSHEPANINTSQSNGTLPRGKYDTQRRSA